MSATIQSGMHPDADSLTAFAEQLLPPAERDQILAHMSTCSRCREVVFLALHAASEGQPSPKTPAAAPAAWFNAWKWMWIPAAAFAGFIGIAVVQHFRHAAESTQMTAKLSHTDALRSTEIAKSTPANTQQAPRPKAELKRQQTTRTSAERDDTQLQADKDETKQQLEEKESVEQRGLAGGATGGPTLVSPGLSGGSVHGTMARKKSSPYDGPVAANQFQQQNQAQQNLAQQNAVQQNVHSGDANKPAMASAAPASASQTVTVQAKTMELAPTAAPAAPPQASSTPLSDQKFDVASGAVAGLGKAKKVSLPNGLGVLSVASEASRTVALDTAGALFLSEDRGKHWQPVPTQWSGRAILVRTRPVETQNGALQAPLTTRFELVNDKLQTWVSYDGKTWTAQPLPLN